MQVGLLLVRLAVGLTVAAQGAQRLFGVFAGHGLAGTAEFLDSLRFRPGRAHAWALALAESGGGLLLALGWLTPLGPPPLAARRGGRRTPTASPARRR